MSETTLLSRPPVLKDIDLLAINTIRTLSIDGVQAADSGHPGTPMALAPVAYCLWQQFLRFVAIVTPEDGFRGVEGGSHAGGSRPRSTARHTTPTRIRLDGMTPQVTLETGHR